MAMKKCPVCGVAVKVENLEKHVRNQHPHEHVDTAALFTSEEKQALTESKAASRPALTGAGKRTVVIVAVVLVAILAAAVVATTWRPATTNIGTTAPSFTLTTSTGTVVNSPQYRGKPLLLEFMNTECPACNTEAPILSSLYQAYQTRVAFLSVDMPIASHPLNTVDEINTFKSNMNTPWDYGIDSNGAVVSAYAVSATPTIFIVDAKGVIAAMPVYPSGTTYSALSASLDQVLG